MFKLLSKNSPFYLMLWLLMALVPKSIAFAQQSQLIRWPPIIWPTLTENLIGDDGRKIIRVYLPPSYDFTEKRYPVIYVLHGFGGDSGSLSDRVKSRMDRMIPNEEIQEMIAVFVDGSNRFGGSQYLSSPTIGDYETYIVRDLVNFIDRQYRTIAHRDSRGITGFSMGGYGSMHLVLKYPEVFSVVVPQASTYDFEDDLVTAFTEAGGAILALLEPVKQSSGDRFWAALEELANSQAVRRISLPFRNGLAYLAAVASNPDKPPCYLDLPYKLRTGFPPWERVDEVWERIIENDTIHQLDRYLNRLQQNPEQLVRLKGIKLVHGLEDETALFRQAEALDQKMTELGIVHEFKAHDGGHRFIAEESLQFMSEHLAFEPPPATSDGSGTASISPFSVTAHSDGVEMVMTYTAEGEMRGGAMTAHVAAGWTPPQGTPGLPGYTTAASTGMIGDTTFTKQRIQVDIQILMPGDTITIVYGNGGGSSGATAPADRISTFIISSASRSDGTLTLIRQSPVVEVYLHPWDVNDDGIVNIVDLTIVGSNFGEVIEGVLFGQNPDVNRDGIVNLFDLVTIGVHFGETIGSPAAPESFPMPTSATIKFENPRFLGARVLLDMMLDTAIPLAGYHIQIRSEGLLKVDPNTGESDVFRQEAGAQSGTLVAAKLGVGRPWLGRVRLATLELEANTSAELRWIGVDSAPMDRGSVQALNPIVSLDEAYLVSVDGQSIPVGVEPFFIDTLRPRQTRLFPNYPNPFNPETWIPFQLHEDTHVRITIYDASGREIQKFDLGHQPAGYYKTRERAVYWDARNRMGERVASGTYFYRLETDDFVSMHRMVVLK